MALLLALSGTSLWLLFPGDARTPVRYVARFFAMLVALIGAATRIEYLFGVNLRIDQILFRNLREPWQRLSRDACRPHRQPPFSRSA